MPEPIKIHNARPTLHLPAHEQAARRRRAEAAALPGIPGTPGSRPPRRPETPVHKGRKTFDTRILTSNF